MSSGFQTGVISKERLNIKFPVQQGTKMNCQTICTETYNVNRHILASVYLFIFFFENRH